MTSWLQKIKFESIRFFRGGVAAARYIGVGVGKECRILTRNFDTEPWLVSIGDRVTVTDGVTFLTHDGSTWLIRDQQGRRFRYARILIGDDVFIGMNTILLPGVQIGSRVIVGAGSVVTKSVPSDMVVGGNPAKIIGRFEDYRARALAQFSSASDMRGQSFRQRIESIADPEFRAFMT